MFAFDDGDILMEEFTLKDIQIKSTNNIILLNSVYEEIN